MIALSMLFLWLFAKVLVLPGTDQFDWHILYFIVAPSLLIVVAVRGAMKKLEPELSPLDGVILIWLAAMTITTAFSINSIRSANMIMLDVAYGTIFFMAFQLTVVGWTTPAMFLRATWFGSAYYFFAIGVLMINFYVLGGTGPFRPPSANMIAGLLNLLLLPTFAAFLTRPRWPSVTLMGIALTVIFITASRGGWLGLAAGLIVLLARERAALAPLAARVRHFLPVAVTIGAVVGMVGLWQLNLPMRGDHTEFWSLAWNVFASHPIVGTGPGTFQIWRIAAAPSAIPYTHAHSLILNTAAEQGIIGLIALAVLAVCTLRAAWPHPGLFAALIAFAAQNLVDGTHPEPAIMVTLAVLIGSTLGQKGEQHGEEAKNKGSQGTFLNRPPQGPCQKSQTHAQAQMKIVRRVQPIHDVG